MLETIPDVLVIGGGVAGLRAAIAAYDEGGGRLAVAVVSKVHPLRSYSALAQGGINAALYPPDSWEVHAHDTVHCADFLADQDVVEVLCREGPEAVAELEAFGVPFDRLDDETLARRAFAGASAPRASFVADRTGLVVLHALYGQALRRGITFLDEWYVLNLIVEDDGCHGVVALHIPSGQVHAMRSRTTILATGEHYCVYQTVTKTRMSTGDGTALAYRAGVPLRGMEFVQFQPTTLIGSFISFSEAARYEGGYLKNRLGERFMERYVPQMMELAPRDVLSRSIQTEIEEGRGFEPGYVHLDLTHLLPEKVRARLPQVCEQAWDFAGIDATREPLPVRPGFGSGMGGIDADVDGTTIISGLFGAGACAYTGVHGANQTGGNPLAMALVTARRAGKMAARLAHDRPAPSERGVWVRQGEDRIAGLTRNESSGSTFAIRRQLGDTMLASAGPYREGAKLGEAVGIVRELRAQYDRIGVRDRSKAFNTELVEALETRSLLDLAEAIVASALARQESRGTHYRKDFPARDDVNWLCHNVVHWSEDGPRVSQREVVITRYPVGTRY